MFTRAGFNPRHTVVCRARVALNGATRTFEARLIRFVPSGEFAWHSRSGSFLVWGDRVRVLSLIGISPLSRLEYSNIEAHHRRIEAAREAGILREVA